MARNNYSEKLLVKGTIMAKGTCLLFPCFFTDSWFITQNKSYFVTQTHTTSKAKKVQTQTPHPKMSNNWSTYKPIQTTIFYEVGETLISFMVKQRHKQNKNERAKKKKIPKDNENDFGNYKITKTLLQLGTSSCKAFILSAILSLRNCKRAKAVNTKEWEHQ